MTKLFADRLTKLRQARIAMWVLGIAGYPLLAWLSQLLPFNLPHIGDLPVDSLGASGYSGQATTPVPAIWLPLGLSVALMLVHRRRAMMPLLIGILISALLGLSYTAGFAATSFTTTNFPTTSFATTNSLAINLLLLMTSGLLALLQPIMTLWFFDRARAADERTLVAANARAGEAPLLSYVAFLWLLAAATVASIISAAIISGLFQLIDQVPLRALSQSLLRFWLADFIAIVALTPLLVTQWYRPPLRITFRRPFEWVVWLVSLVFVLGMAQQNQLKVIYLLLPLTTWAATRFSLPGSMLAIAMATLAGLALLSLDLQAGKIPLSEALLLETLLALFATSACYVRVLLEDRRRVENSLENIVEERTRELQIRNFELKDEIFVRQQAEKSFRRSSHHYRALVETASNPIIVIDPDFRIRKWNSAAEMLFGYSRDDAAGMDLLKSFTPDAYQDEMAWKITKVISSGILKESIESEAHAYNGSRHIMLWNINRLNNEDDEAAQAILIGQDITEIRETQDQLHYLAHYDVLTQTANRRLFEDRCRMALASAMRHDHQCALLSLDIDHFKRINDTLGHDTGDQLLQEIASRLLNAVRKEDTVARLGGDEFAVLLYKVAGPEGCDTVARNILDALVKPIPVSSGELVITSSIGVTLAPHDGKSYEEMLKNADMAMYRAKKAGRNNIQFFSADMNDEIQKQVRLEKELRAAISDGDLELHYQPVMDVHTGRIVAMEALLRWRHQERGLLAPGEFLDIAEQTGQLLRLSTWIYQNACLQGLAMQTMSSFGPVQISINVSSRQYNHPQLLETLSQIIKDTRIDPRLLCLEIDEHLLADRIQDTSVVLQRIKGLGVQLVLDRFGSGLSSIRLLRELPFDQVKIDRELLDEALYDENTSAIVGTLIKLARQLSLTVAAAGVESEEQERFLRRSGCHLVQGHRYSKAIASDQLPELFERIRTEGALLKGNQFDLLT